MSQEDDDLKLEKKSLRMSTPESRFQELMEKLIERVKVNEQESRQRDDEQKRRIEFVVEQQAQFAADMQQFATGMERLRETQARAEERAARTEEKWGRMWERTHENIISLVAAAELQAQEINGLASAQAKTDRQMAETTDKLNALIDIVAQLANDRRTKG